MRRDCTLATAASSHGIGTLVLLSEGRRDLYDEESPTEEPRLVSAARMMELLRRPGAEEERYWLYGAVEEERLYGSML